MTGSLHFAITLEAGDVIRAEVDRFGAVTIKVAEGS
jgi:2-keto-4-pentenoate hydratase